ncbi:Leucine-rich repeat-containing protein 51 [Blastocladiella emersonii ATCC 22665]|nr:Leucine-rich repeat-containing protein 51 [Blastocladiella emersonii ATCC 22665]
MPTAVKRASGMAGADGSGVESIVSQEWASVPAEPLDLSFRDATNVTDFFAELDEEAELARAAAEAAEAAKQAANTAKAGEVQPVVLGALSGNAPVERPKQVLVVHAVKLCNNQLAKVDHLDGLLSRLGVSFANLRWLDLSFNCLTGIDEGLAACSALSHLYLHANRMENLTAVARALARLPYAEQLATLTLHGNPLADHKDYKATILRACPRLRHLDFGGVSRADRALVRHAGTALGKR